MGIQGAKLANYASDSADQALQQFSQWMNPCGATTGLPPDMAKAFGILNGAPNSAIPGPGGKKGWSAPAGLKPGKNAGSKSPPSPPKDKDPPKDSPAKTHPPKTHPSETHSPKTHPFKSSKSDASSQTSACAIQKRAGKNSESPPLCPRFDPFRATIETDLAITQRTMLVML